MSEPAMLSSTIVLSGKVVVNNVMFSWWVTDATKPRVTVSHPVHGAKTLPISGSNPRAQARAIAREMLAGQSQASPADVSAVEPIGNESTVVLGDDYRLAVESSFNKGKL